MFLCYKHTKNAFATDTGDGPNCYTVKAKLKIPSNFRSTGSTN